MLRLSPQIRALVSYGLLASYLAAAFLDCEPVRPTFASFASAGMGAIGASAVRSERGLGPMSGTPGSGHAAPIAQTGGHDRGHGHGNGHGNRHENGHGSHDSGHGNRHDHGTAHHGVSEMKQAPSGHAHGEAHAGNHAPGPADAHGPARKEHKDTKLAAREGGAELKPTCTCGCSESRSRIGGNVSRLGSVIPGVAVAQLPEPVPSHRATEREFSPPNVFRVTDPIPI